MKANSSSVEPLRREENGGTGSSESVVIYQSGNFQDSFILWKFCGK